MSELKPSRELIAVALAAVAKYGDLKYPTGEDRAALCSAAVVLAAAWNTRPARLAWLEKVVEAIRKIAYMDNDEDAIAEARNILAAEPKKEGADESSLY